MDAIRLIKTLQKCLGREYAFSVRESSQLVALEEDLRSIKHFCDGIYRYSGIKPSKFIEFFSSRSKIIFRDYRKISKISRRLSVWNKRVERFIVIFEEKLSSRDKKYIVSFKERINVCLNNLIRILSNGGELHLLVLESKDDIEKWLHKIQEYHEISDNVFMRDKKEKLELEIKQLFKVVYPNLQEMNGKLEEALGNKEKPGLNTLVLLIKQLNNFIVLSEHKIVHPTADKILRLLIDERLVSHTVYDMPMDNPQKIAEIICDLLKMGILSASLGYSLFDRTKNNKYWVEGWGSSAQEDAFNRLIRPYLDYDICLNLGMSKDVLSAVVKRIIGEFRRLDEKTFFYNLGIQRRKVFWNTLIRTCISSLKNKFRDSVDFINDIRYNYISSQWVSTMPADHTRAAFIHTKLITFWWGKYKPIGVLIYKPDITRTPFLKDEDVGECCGDWLVYNRIKPNEFAAIVIPEKIFLEIEDLLPKGITYITNDLKLLRE